MISSQIHHRTHDFDDVIETTDLDFVQSGLKNTSLVRVGRLAVVNESLLLGAIGEVDASRLARIRTNLANWLLSQ